MTSVAALTIPFMTATTVEAHPGCKYHRSTSRASARRTTYRRTNTTYASYPSQAYANGYSDSYGNEYVTTRTTSTVVKRPGFYSRHRRLVNTGIGAAAGAIIGGLIGGKRGAGIGILGGGLGSQVFTRYQRPRNYTRYRY